MKPGQNLDLADMDISYDIYGKAMRVKKLNYDSMQDNQNKPHTFLKAKVEKAVLKEEQSALRTLKEYLERKKEND
jgi:hypothetical protein